MYLLGSIAFSECSFQSFLPLNVFSICESLAFVFIHFILLPNAHRMWKKDKAQSSKNLPCTKAPNTLDCVCNSGCPTTILRNLSNPSLLASITSSLNRFVNTFPGSGGMVTRLLSRSRMSRKASKSEYRRRTVEWRSLKVGITVRQVIS